MTSKNCTPATTNNCTSCNSTSNLTTELREMTERHPCYSSNACHTHARLHLPVAPKCNLSCNYCNRKFNCVNESRPGVTSQVLNPGSALEKFKLIKDKISNVSVVGIAGPGDALANWQNTRGTLELIRQVDKDVVFCLSTNGLMLPEFAPEIIELGIKHVTVTVNCVDPEIGSKIYHHIYYKGQRFTGGLAAELLLKNQTEGIKYLVNHGVLVKINIVMIKDLNDFHIPAVVRYVKDLGVFVTNIMPLIPAPGSAFEHHPQTNMKDLTAMRRLCERDVKQMYHCQQCRADAVGLLGEDRSQEFSQAQSDPFIGPNSKGQYRIAVTSKHGRAVDLHFGHAAEFAIYSGDGEVFELLEKRTVPKYCNGVEDCDSESTKEKVLETITDCDAILTLRIGYHAKQRLQNNGILSVESCDSINNGLRFAVQQLNLANQCTA